MLIFYNADTGAIEQTQLGAFPDEIKQRFADLGHSVIEVPDETDLGDFSGVKVVDGALVPKPEIEVDTSADGDAVVITGLPSPCSAAAFYTALPAGQEPIWQDTVPDGTLRLTLAQPGAYTVTFQAAGYRSLSLNLER